MYDKLYRATIVVKNRGNNALKCLTTVPPYLRGVVEFIPDMFYLQVCYVFLAPCWRCAVGLFPSVEVLCGPSPFPTGAFVFRSGCGFHIDCFCWLVALLACGCRQACDRASGAPGTFDVMLKFRAPAGLLSTPALADFLTADNEFAVPTAFTCPDQVATALRMWSWLRASCPFMYQSLHAHDSVRLLRGFPSSWAGAAC